MRAEYALAKTSDAVQNRSTADSVVVAAELGSDWGTSATRLNPVDSRCQPLAAHRAGLTDVIVPRRNEPDLDDVPEYVRR